MVKFSSIIIEVLVILLEISINLLEFSIIFLELFRLLSPLPVFVLKVAELNNFTWRGKARNWVKAMDLGLEVLRHGEEATFTIEILTFRDTQLRMSLLRTEFRLFGLLCLGCH